MKLNKRIKRHITSELVRRANELYHNAEGDRYDALHREMHRVEKTFWQDVAKEYLSRPEPLVCLDFGTGTGLVALSVGPYLKAADTLICTDISSELLKQGEINVAKAGLRCQASFIKTDGLQIPVADDSVDVIMLNSVLHHIHQLDAFADECRRVLRSGGLVIVNHEPNDTGWLPLSFRLVRSVCRGIYRPKLLFVKLAESSPFLEKAMRSILSKTNSNYRWRNAMLADIARQLKKEGLIDFDLRGVEVQQIVDIHSEQGFVGQEIITESFARFKVLEWSTYNHLGCFGTGKLYKLIDAFMKTRWPAAGSNIRFVLALGDGCE